jgi:hypothetical protein
MIKFRFGFLCIVSASCIVGVKTDFMFGVAMFLALYGVIMVYVSNLDAAIGIITSYLDRLGKK